jgi:tryptophan synthase beta chain
MKNNYSEPNSEGFFGSYGGKFVPETLMEALDELEKCYEGIKSDSEFQKKIDRDLADFVGRPSPLYFAERLTEHFKGPNIWLKREDLKSYWCAQNK